MDDNQYGDTNEDGGWWRSAVSHKLLHTYLCMLIKQVRFNWVHNDHRQVPVKSLTLYDKNVVRYTI